MGSRGSFEASEIVGFEGDVGSAGGGNISVGLEDFGKALSILDLFSPLLLSHSISRLFFIYCPPFCPPPSLSLSHVDVTSLTLISHAGVFPLAHHSLSLFSPILLNFYFLHPPSLLSLIPFFLHLSHFYSVYLFTSRFFPVFLF